MEINALDFWKTVSVTFAALFPIVNPVGGAPLFFGLTRTYPEAAQKILARKIAAYSPSFYWPRRSLAVRSSPSSASLFS